MHFCTYDAAVQCLNSFHTEKVEIPVKSELPATVKACTFEEQIKGVALSIFHVLLLHIKLTKIEDLLLFFTFIFTFKSLSFMTLFTAMQTETSCLNNVIMLPMVKREEPMEVSCNAAPSDIFKVV